MQICKWVMLCTKKRYGESATQWISTQPANPKRKSLTKMAKQKRGTRIDVLYVCGISGHNRRKESRFCLVVENFLLMGQKKRTRKQRENGRIRVVGGVRSYWRLQPGELPARVEIDRPSCVYQIRTCLGRGYARDPALNLNHSCNAK